MCTTQYCSRCNQETYYDLNIKSQYETPCHQTIMYGFDNNANTKPTSQSTCSVPTGKQVTWPQCQPSSVTVQSEGSRFERGVSRTLKTKWNQYLEVIWGILPVEIVVAGLKKHKKSRNSIMLTVIKCSFTLNDAFIWQMSFYICI